METLLIVDRIENGIAACEGDHRVMREIPLVQLPPGIKEGDCLRPCEDGGYIIDQEETLRRRAHNRALLRALLEKGNKQTDS